MPFSQKLRTRILAVAEEHETRLSSLIPALREVQKDMGWLSVESMEEVAEILEIPPSSVQNVATFYTMFFTEPAGRHVVWLCRTLSCALRGAEHLEHHLCGKLGVGMGETTADGKITLMVPSVSPRAEPPPPCSSTTRCTKTSRKPKSTG